METAAAAQGSAPESNKVKAPKKVIKGNLPYTPAPGVFKKTLEGVITAGQPERFTSNFMDTVLGVSGTRSAAAYSGLKGAFSELFQRNEFIHKANESEVRDNIVALTGLTKNDAYVSYIWSTFKVLRDFITGDPATQPKAELTTAIHEASLPSSLNSGSARIGLVNSINIVLPESTNINVYNLIFQSLRANLLS
jgi:hypothetical protein